PVLAAWQYGAGRAAAWTPDVAGRWSGAWASGPSATEAASTLWSNLLSWLLPGEDSGELVVRVEAEPDGGYAVVAENRTVWADVRPTRATLLGPEGSRLELELAPSGPGRYRQTLDGAEPGAYVVQAIQTASSSPGAPPVELRA